MKKVRGIFCYLVVIIIIASLFTGCGKSSAEVQFEGPQKGQKIAVITIKDYGQIKAVLFEEQAPKTVENFVTHAENGYYDGLIFHRVISDFMIQGGDPEGTGAGGESIWGDTFADEFTSELRNYTGALSMANSGPDTNKSQFFIVNAPLVPKEAMEYYVENMKLTREYIAQGMTRYDTKYAETYGEIEYSSKEIEKYGEVGGTPWLDRVHTVFGQVYEGLEVVKKIMGVEVDENSKPATDVIIESIEIITYEE